MGLKRFLHRIGREDHAASPPRRLAASPPRRLGVLLVIGSSFVVGGAALLKPSTAPYFACPTCRSPTGWEWQQIDEAMAYLDTGNPDCTEAFEYFYWEFQVDTAYDTQYHPKGAHEEDHSSPDVVVGEYHVNYAWPIWDLLVTMLHEGAHHLWALDDYDAQEFGESCLVAPSPAVPPANAEIAATQAATPFAFVETRSTKGPWSELVEPTSVRTKSPVDPSWRQP